MLDKIFTEVHPLFSARQTVIKIQFIYSVQGNCKIINLQIEKMKCLYSLCLNIKCLTDFI